jgi:hypothetical protein
MTNEANVTLIGAQPATDRAEYHASRASRMLEIVGRHRPGPRRRRLLVEATREHRMASASLSGQ